MIKIYLKKWLVFVKEGEMSVPFNIVSVHKFPIKFRTDVDEKRSPQVIETIVEYGYIITIDLFLFVVNLRFSI